MEVPLEGHGWQSGFRGAVVQILDDGVSFGYKGHGFTLSGSAGLGVSLDEGDPAFGGGGGVVAGITRGISVGGNIAVGSGFSFNGPGVRIPPCPPEGEVCPNNTGQVLFADNQAVGNGFGVVVNALFGPGPIILRNNLALNAAGAGFQVAARHQLMGDPRVFSAGQVQLLNNVATGCQLGFSANVSGPIEHNTAFNNRLAGFLIAPVSAIQYNSAISNGGPGIILQFSPDPFTRGPDGTGGAIIASVNNSNFFGNDRHRSGLTVGVGDFPLGGAQYDPGPSAHCGILNVGDLEPLLNEFQNPAGPTITVSARFNYWGSSKGPQASGAGDNVGGACDQNGGVTKATPFNVTPLAVNSFQP